LAAAVGDEDAAAGTRFEQPALFKHRDRIADDRSAHAKHHGEITSRRQPIARSHPLPDDVALDQIGDPRTEQAALGRGIW
jgi:hypothetical protein